MKIQTVTLAMMALMLSAGPLIAMDAEYQEKRRQALYAESGSSTIQAVPSIDHRDRDVDKRGDGQHRRVDDEGEMMPEAWRQ